MATLTERQAAERKSLERLSDTLDKRARDLASLMQVLAAARDFSGLDPVEHVQAAMRHYVREQPTQSHPIPEITDDDSLAREIGEIGDQLHNLSCEHQHDDELSARLGTIASALWSLARRTPDPVPGAPTHNSRSKP